MGPLGTQSPSVQDPQSPRERLVDPSPPQPDTLCRLSTVAKRTWSVNEIGCAVEQKGCQGTRNSEERTVSVKDGWVCPLPVLIGTYYLCISFPILKYQCIVQPNHMVLEGHELVCCIGSSVALPLRLITQLVMIKEEGYACTPRISHRWGHGSDRMKRAPLVFIDVGSSPH
jgi:hypothetical protein